MEISINGKLVMQGEEIIGSFKYISLITLSVFDHRINGGWVGFMNYQDMLDYFGVPTN